MPRFLGTCALLLGLAACHDADSGAAKADAASEVSRDAGSPDSQGERSASGAPNADDAQVPGAPRALVHNALWVEAMPQEDPFPRDAATHCLPDSYGEEDLGGELVFYVRTDSCPSVSVQQGTRLDVHAGDQLSVRVYHFPLTAPVPALARLILQLDDSEIFRDEIPIPSDAADLRYDWTAPRDFPRGTPLWFHVENHGSNEYVLVEVNLF